LVQYEPELSAELRQVERQTGTKLRKVPISSGGGDDDDDDDSPEDTALMEDG
jgi:hypothetical protein